LHPFFILCYLKDLFDHRSQEWHLRASKIIISVAHRNNIEALLHRNKIIDNTFGKLLASAYYQAGNNEIAIPVKLIVLINAAIGRYKFIGKSEMCEFILRIEARDLFPIPFDVSETLSIILRGNRCRIGIVHICYALLKVYRK